MTTPPQQADKPYEARGKVEWLQQQQRMRVISGPFFCKVAKGWMARQFLNMGGRVSTGGTSARMNERGWTAGGGGESGGKIWKGRGRGGTEG